jgi:hypothetical protein
MKMREWETPSAFWTIEVIDGRVEDLRDRMSRIL